jgi:type II secretory pathway pseudopilin PulG
MIHLCSGVSGGITARSSEVLHARLSRKPSGFALVATLLLMVLLALLSIGMLSLSGVSLRTSGQDSARSQARANARMALMIAIGELQKQLGSDQRVSANGSILSETQVQHPHWTGVWDSWKAGPADAANPGPDPESDHRTIPGSSDVSNGMSPTYSANRSDHFRSWLLSLSPGEAADISSARDLGLEGTRMPGSDATAVQLVGKGSLKLPGDTGEGYDPDYVSARLLPVQSQSGTAITGRYGWWVGDESQKARIMDDSYESDGDTSLAGRLSRQQAPGSTGTQSVRGLENITNDLRLAGLPSLGSLALADGATGEAPLNFHHVTPFSYGILADVREGGLKRDLSTLLERPIDTDEFGDDFMLYKFNEKERVPIQDLAAYFQLYHQSIGDSAVGNKGVQYSSDSLTSGIQIPTPDYGGSSTRDKFHRQYTGLYRSPVPIKLQFLLGLIARPRAPADITAQYPGTHELYLTITLGMTLWNPTNLPMVMDTRGRLFQRIRWWYMAFGIQWAKDGWTHDAPLKNIMGAGGNFACELDISRNVPLVFAPGEVKVLSLPYSPTTTLDFQRWDGENSASQRLLEGWDPNGFMSLSRSANTNNQAPHIRYRRLLFSEGDQIQLTVNADSAARQALLFQLGQDSYHDNGIRLERSYYNYTLATQGDSNEFNKSLLLRGFEGNEPITVDLPITTILNGSAEGESWPFLNFSMMAGSETREGVSPSGIGGASGRKFASRPFLHSSAIRPSTMDADNPDAFYNYGWNWWIEPINSILEAPVQVSENGNGYYGGGYGPTFGTTHIVQQEIPVVPPMSIASLSHAHLGGFSLADSIPTQPWSATLEPTPLATGRGGLFPSTLQAVGNSYAHPLIKAGEAYDAGFQRTFRSGDGATTVVFADHSYLANKALWDEFFFSSITPQPASVEAFGVDRTANEVASDFFFGKPSKPLPNRRITAYKGSLDEGGLDELFTKSDDFNDGLADRIAAHLMVEGPFNVNSTSVEAWKILLSSLKGKPVAYMPTENSGTSLPDMAPHKGVPVSGFNLPGGEAATKADTSEPSESGPWLGARELSEPEIEELAAAIVKQVKLRGPFLSLSDFVNRRLDGSDPALSVKGALQAALDDEDVSVNAAFRTPAREFSASEKSTMSPAFPEALEGPVAYGSSAYVDQADVLRSLSSQLTPRGDTFVIRTYGDSLDPSGKVLARAWCEAVVQRVPEYLDPTDEPHIKQADLLSEANKAFGRKLEVVGFRWLNPSEI